MRWLLPLFTVLAAAGPAPAGADGSRCRYDTVVISTSSEADGMTGADAALGRQVASLLRLELDLLGLRPVESVSDAYWSLLIMAARDRRNNGFVFTATLALRRLAEGEDPGLVDFSAGEASEVGPPALYTGLAYGASEQLPAQARSFAESANRALIPTRARLCDFIDLDLAREEALESRIPAPL